MSGNPVKSLLQYRDYINYAVRMNIRNRYNNMYLGILWLILDPLLYMAVLTLVYVIIFDRNAENFPVYVLIGLIFWKWMSSSVVRSTNSITVRLGVMEQVPVPKQVFVFVDIVVETIFFVLSSFLIFVLLIIYDVPFTWHILEGIIITIIAFIFLYGLGLIVSHLGTYVADFRIIVSYILWLIFFLTPIFYYVNTASEKVLMALKFNPAYAFIQAFRDVYLYGVSANFSLLLIWLLIGILMIFGGTWILTKYDKKYVLLK